MRGPIDVRFEATLGKAKPGDTWTCVQLQGSAEVFDTPGLVKVAGMVAGHPFNIPVMALADGTPSYRLPLPYAAQSASPTATPWWSI